MPDKRESRAYERDALNLITTCTPHWGAQVSSVTLRNLSRGGVGLVTSKRFEVGDTFVVEILTVTKMVTVAHIRPEGSQWYIGCRFISRLGEAEWAGLLLGGKQGDQAGNG